MSNDAFDMQELWQNYLFLTTELGKFTSPEDVDLFADLLNQRERLMMTIKQTSDDKNYIKSLEGQAFIKYIAELDATVYEKMSLSKNMLRKKFELSSAYDGYSLDSVAVGGNFDSKSN